MKTIICMMSSGSRCLSYFLGLCVICVAVAAMWTTLEVQEIANWAIQVFGITFLCFFGALIFVTLFCWTRMRDAMPSSDGCAVWHDCGLHAANSISTLALTYTLLGISLGIGTLAHQDLTPDSIQGIIQSLTKHFSLAFLTTVIGIPTAAVMRALIGITATKIENFKIITPTH
jgi:hypothetical protein